MASVFHRQMQRARNDAAHHVVRAVRKLRPATHASVLEVDAQFADDFSSKLNAKDARAVASAGAAARVPAHTSLAVEDDFHTRVPRGFIHPLSWQKLAWDLLVSLLIVYSALVVPLRICFDIDTNATVRTWGYVVDAFFFADIVVSFFTVYMDELGKPVLNHRRIADHYVRTWFVVDALSTTPVDLVVEILDPSSASGGVASLRLLRVLRLARLLKMVRLLKINKLLAGAEGVQDMLNVNPAIVRLAKFFFLAAFMGHLLGCFWFWVGSVQPMDLVSWIDDAGITHADLWTQYLTAMYWTFATITTVGYGDVHALTNYERMYSVFAQLIGASAFGFIIGNISSILERMDARAAAFNRKMSTLKEYLAHRQFPPALAKRIMRYYEYYHTRKSSFDEASILSEVSNHLRNQIVLQSNQEAVMNIRFFQHQDEGLIASLITAMKPMFQMAGEMLCHQGHVGKEMYFVLKGMIEATVDDIRYKPTLVGIYLRGSYCADTALVLNSRRPLSLRAVTHCDLFALSKEDLGNALYHYEEVNRDMTQAARHRLQLLADVRYSTVHALQSQGLKCRIDAAAHVEEPRPELAQRLKNEVFVFVNDKLKPSRMLHDRHLTEATLVNTQEYAPCGRMRNVPRSKLKSLVLLQMASTRMNRALAARAEAPNRVMAADTSLESDAVTPYSASQPGPAAVHSAPASPPCAASKGEPQSSLHPTLVAPAADNTGDAERRSLAAADKAAFTNASPIQGNQRAQATPEAVSHTTRVPRSFSLRVASNTPGASPGAISVNTGASTSQAAPAPRPVSVLSTESKISSPTNQLSRGVSSMDAGEATGDDDQPPFDMLAGSNIPRLVINPRSTPKVLWDIWIGCLILLSVLSVPFFIGFDQSPQGGWFYANVVVDTFFVLDMVATFRTAYYTPFDAELIVSNRRIAEHYLKTWFIVDLVSAVPWDWIITAATQQDSLSLRSLKLVRVLRLARLVKLFRLFRLTKTTDAFLKFFNVPTTVGRLMKLFFQVAFIAHLMACFWFYVSTLEDSDTAGAWWKTANMEHSSVGSLYIAGVYFAYTTMTTVGYGDIVAVSNTEKLFAVFAMIVGGSTFGYIVGSMASLFGRFNGGDARNKEKMDQVVEYMRERKLTQGLRRKVRKYYQFYLDRKTAFNEAAILGDLTEGLKTEAVLHLNRDIIGKIPFLKQHTQQTGGVDDGFTSYIMSIMNPMFVVPDDYIFKQGEIGLEMYFLVKGEVSVMKSVDDQTDEVIATLSDGSFFGEIAVLIGTKRTASVRAKTYCNLFTLKKDDLNLMIMHYPTLGKMMQDSIMSKLESMVQGEVAMVSQEEALRMAKSMRREVHRLGAMVQQVSKMNILQKSSTRDILHCGGVTAMPGKLASQTGSQRSRLGASPVGAAGSGRGTPGSADDAPPASYDSEEEEMALRASFRTGTVHGYLKRDPSAHSVVSVGRNDTANPDTAGQQRRGSEQSLPAVAESLPDSGGSASAVRNSGGRSMLGMLALQSAAGTAQPGQESLTPGRVSSALLVPNTTMPTGAGAFGGRLHSSHQAQHQLDRERARLRQPRLSSGSTSILPT